MEPIDLELEAQLKKYSASKKAKNTQEKSMLADFSETEEESVTINQSFDSNDLMIEEDEE